MFTEHYFSEHPVYQEPSLGTLYRQNRERSRLTHECGLQMIDELLVQQHPSQLIVESAPLYAVPSEEYFDQAVNSVASLSASSFTEDVFAISQKHAIPYQHWILLDDINNGSDMYTKSQVWNEFIHAVSNEIPIYGQITRKQFESDYHTSDGSTCASMDAGFQMAKILEATRDFTELEELPLFINVHPVGFKNQQRSMLERLRNLIKTDRNAHAMQISKSMKSNLIQDTFIHVWTDEHNQIEVTRPVLMNGSIVHTPITT